MIATVLSCLLNLLNELRNRDKMRGLLASHFIPFFATTFINSIIQEHLCKILLII